MNDYEERQEAKRDRYLELAEKNERLSYEKWEAGKQETAGIPFGQPILVGHHSEWKHRATLRRQDAKYRGSIEAQEKADYYKRKAAGVGTGGISQDDPDAIKKLHIQLEEMKRSHETMKRFNDLWRKAGRPDPTKQEDWYKISDEIRSELKHSGFRWSRRNGCWQSYLTGEYRGRKIAERIKEGDLV